MYVCIRTLSSPVRKNNYLYIYAYCTLIVGCDINIYPNNIYLSKCKGLETADEIVGTLL